MTDIANTKNPRSLDGVCVYMDVTRAAGEQLCSYNSPGSALDIRQIALPPT